MTSYDDVRGLLADPRLSADRRNPDFPFSSPSREALDRADPSFVAFDDPDHARIRRTFTRYFTVKRIAGLQPVVDGIVGDLVDELAGRDTPVDFTTIAAEVPARTICHVLGIPLNNRTFFQEQDAVRNTLGTQPDAVRSATDRMLGFAADLIETKRREPADDLVSDLVHSDAVATLTPQELLHSVRLLITAGHETTSNMIGLSVLTLLTHREQWDRLVADRELVPSAVEELLRYISIFHISPTRVALEPMEIQGIHIDRGDGIILATAGANRDPQVFAERDSFDVGRDARGHVAFGSVSTNASGSRSPGWRSRRCCGR